MSYGHKFYRSGGEDLSEILARLDALEAANPSDPAQQQIAGTITADGSQSSVAGATITRISTGRYDVVFDTPRANDVYPILTGVEDTTARDDISAYYIDQTVNGFRIQVTEQDNGGAAGVYRDRSVSFYCPAISL